MIRFRPCRMVVAGAMIALLLRPPNSANGRPCRIKTVPGSTALRPPVPTRTARSRVVHSGGASVSIRRSIDPIGVDLACSRNSLLHRWAARKPHGTTCRMTLDGSTDPPATDAARTNEFARVGSENVGRAEAAKKTLELESERSEQRTASDLRIRATTEKLRMMIQSGRVTSNAGTPEEQIRDREICEAEKTQERPLVSQTLTVAAEQLRLQGEGLFGPQVMKDQLAASETRHDDEVLETEPDVLGEKLREQDSLIEELREAHGQGYDRFAALVGQEAHKIDAELFMRLADFADTIMDVNERGTLLEMGDDIALAWDRADKARELKVSVETIDDTVWPRKHGGRPMTDKSTALRLSVGSKFCWNESYERCSYDEAKGRFPEWLEEYERDRADHERARSAHPDPAKLDAEFAAAFKEATSCCSTQRLIFGMGPLTDILLSGARASPEHFWDYELTSNLGEFEDLLAELGTRRAPGAEELFDALTASGSVALLTNRIYVGNGGEALWNFVFQAVMYGHFWGRKGEVRTPLGELLFRRASFRLLTRMSFLGAEHGLAEGASHRFMSLPCGKGSPWYPSDYIIEYRRCGWPRENYDSILHVMYLAVFMYRHYPWPQPQQSRVDEDIAELLQDNHSRCRHGVSFHGVDVVRSTLELATTMPGFFRALLEDDALWLLLAARGCEGESATFQSDFKIACALQHFTSGREMGPWRKYFRSRRDERELRKILTRPPGLSAWLCSEVGRFALFDICRQRRRRLLEAVAEGAPSAFAAIVPELLAFVRGPNVRGKKERIVEWLESMLEQSQEY